VSKDIADTAARALKAAEAKTEVWILPVGPDIARGWGKRRSVAEDFLYDYPVMLGSQRVGPDLANVGSRLPDANWHLLHLYNPRITIKNSLMPPYRFLFETRDIGKTPSPDAFRPSEGFQPPPGKEIVPKPEAKALVAYLMSLHADAPLFVAPVTVPAPPPSGTNAAPTTEAGATNAPATNPPAK
jgi:cytochrome c oxidase cbb3-type subunit 2